MIKPLMRWNFLFFIRPSVASDPLALSETAGRADLVPGVERNAATPPAHNMGLFLPFSH
jgi:hypothetical protein